MANIFDRVLEEPKNDLSKNIFDRVSSKLKQKGGDKNAYQTSESSDRSSKNRNEQGVQASPIEASSSEGIQPNEQPGSQDQQIVQRGQQANLTGDSSFINGGETIEGQKEISQGDEATKEGQRVRVKSPAGNKEEVMAGGVQPPKSNIFDRLAGQEKEKRVSPGFTEEMSTSQGREAFVATALETGIPMALGSVAATFAGTAAAAASVPFAGPAAPLVGIGAGAATFLATQELASKILVKPIEGFLGLKEGVESAQAASPESTKYGGYAGMLPFLAESGAGFVKTGVEAAAKALQGQAAQAVTKAVAKKAAAGFAGGVAFEPARYAFEATEKGLGITDEAPKDITGGSLLESGVMGLVLGGKVEEAKTEAGKKVIRDAGLPESAEMAAQLKTDAQIEKDELLKKTPVQYKSPDRLTKDADGKLRELIAKKENRTISEKELEEHDFLQTYPTPDELASYYGVKVRKEQGPSLSAFKTEDTINSNISKAQTELERLSKFPATKAINKKIETQKKIINDHEEMLQTGKTLEAEMARRQEKKQPSEDATTKPDETKIEETSGIPTEQGKPVVKATAVKAEEGIAPREGEGKKEVNDFTQASTAEEVDAFHDKIKAEAEFIDTPKEKTKFLKEAQKQANDQKKKLVSIQKESDKKAKIEASGGGKENGKTKATPREKKALPKPNGTRLVAAAYRYTDPKGNVKIGYGSNHINAMLDAGVPHLDRKNYHHEGSRENENFGYKTDKDAFITREQAKPISEKSGQFKKDVYDADAALGYEFHSNHTELDDYPRELPIAGGAMNAAEGVHEKDLARGANIHISLSDESQPFEGGADFNVWKEAFLAKNKSASKYSQDRLATIFRESEGVAAHSKFYNQPIEKSVNSRKSWDNKSVDEIRESAKVRRKDDIRNSNDDMDRERALRGYEPVMKAAQQANAPSWDEAMNRMNDNAFYQKGLIASIKTNMRPLNPVDQAVVAHYVNETLEARDIALNELINVEISEKGESPLFAEKQAAADRAAAEFLVATELHSMVGSVIGASLQFRRAVRSADYSRESVLNKGRAAKKKSGSKEKLTDVEGKALLKIADEYKKAQKEYDVMLADQKNKAGIEGLANFLESAQKAQSIIAGERMASPKQEINRHSNALRANPNDPLNVALAVRGMARNLSELLESTNPKKIADEIHNRIKDAMGGGWNKQNTMDVLNGYGAFTQSTEEGLVRTVSEHKTTMDNYAKAVKDAMGRSTDRERQLALDRAIKDFHVEVHSLESQISSHFEDAKNDIANALGELQNHEEACS